MVVYDEFTSEPCKTIHYTYGEIMEELKCCEWPKSVTQSQCEKWTWAKPILTSPMPLIHVVVTIIEHTYQSQPFLTIHYTYDDTLDGLRCCVNL